MSTKKHSLEQRQIAMSSRIGKPKRGWQHSRMLKYHALKIVFDGQQFVQLMWRHVVYVFAYRGTASYVGRSECGISRIGDSYRRLSRDEGFSASELEIYLCKSRRHSEALEAKLIDERRPAHNITFHPAPEKIRSKRKGKESTFVFDENWPWGAS